MGKGEEGVEDAEFVHELESRGVDGVTAEVSEEVFVLFEDGDVVAVTGEEISEHHAGGASAYDAAGGLECWRGSGHSALRVARVG